MAEAESYMGNNPCKIYTKCIYTIYTKWYKPRPNLLKMTKT